VTGNTAIVRGIERFEGRASNGKQIYVRLQSLVLSALSGRRRYEDWNRASYHIDRVMSVIEEKFGSLGGRKFHGFLN